MCLDQIRLAKNTSIGVISDYDSEVWEATCFSPPSSPQWNIYYDIYFLTQARTFGYSNGRSCLWRCRLFCWKDTHIHHYQPLAKIMEFYGSFDFLTQLMVNWWFGTRWFGTFIFRDPRNPNHRAANLRNLSLVTWVESRHGIFRSFEKEIDLDFDPVFHQVQPADKTVLAMSGVHILQLFLGCVGRREAGRPRGPRIAT